MLLLCVIVYNYIIKNYRSF